MLRNYKQEEKLKKMGIQNPQQFIRNQMLEGCEDSEIRLPLVLGILTIIGIIVGVIYFYPN